MQDQLKIFNTITGKKELFKPINEGRIGMYVCGPTVYSDVHLGNCRTFVSFDFIYRYLLHKGYKIRYVRNITDVGHLEGDSDTDAEDKISKKARLEQLEPMEIAQKYTIGFHKMMDVFNTLPPSIEPRATGHILEQIEMVKDIVDNGYGYEVNGSVYFDTVKFVKDKQVYGQLSGRKVEDLLSETRDLKKQDEKRHPSDFAIWIKADPSHLMRWNSPWSVGFPGWHLECSAMSTKYLGKTFDIHGGGGDLKFPHHENEVAQNYGACNCAPANYWMHGNMLLLNGKKMSKSDGNTVTPEQLFTGDSPHLTKGYSPMAVRFFMLQSHYRSTLDLTDDALKAAEKGFRRLMEGYKNLLEISTSGSKADAALNEKIEKNITGLYENLDDDFNSPRALANLFEMVTVINAIANDRTDAENLRPEVLEKMKETFETVIFEVFGLKDETAGGDSQSDDLATGLMELILDLRQRAREEKNWGMADTIRDTLKELGVEVKDSKDGSTWTVNT
ncbi:MAG: cysteine--tRNA ligase [Saprospirales bacterium]|nr:MAG: cysteine--tRNA ligase [Saprospirales bacterium]